MSKTKQPFTISKSPISKQNDASGNAFGDALGDGSAVHSTAQSCTVATHQLDRFVDDWIIDCDIAQHSTRTNEVRRNLLSQLIWFLSEHNHPTCDNRQLRQFFAYLNRGHMEPGGRWKQGKYTKPLRPVTIQNYYKHISCFFNWLVREEYIAESPMQKIPRPIGRADQIQPFTPEQVRALLAAASKSRHPKRDEAIVVMLLDTGLRASELCNLRIENVDIDQHFCRVLGKGNKHRVVPFSHTTKKKLWKYLRHEAGDTDRPLFCSERGLHSGAALTRMGLLQLVERLGRAADLQSTRCSPHTFRHTMAVEYLRNGGNVFALKTILGHTSLHMTNKYVALAEADVQREHRRFSPADHLLGERSARP